MVEFNSIFKSIFLSIIFCCINDFVHAQSDPVKARLSVVQQFFPKYNNHETGFVITFMDTGPDDLYIPYQFYNFSEQEKDSLHVSVKNGNIYEMFKKYGGRIVNPNSILGSNDRNLYYQHGDSILWEQMRMQNAIKAYRTIDQAEGSPPIPDDLNPLLLRSGKEFKLYFVLTNHDVFRQDGEYKVSFIYGKITKPTDGLPERILIHKKDVPEDVSCNDLYIKVKESGKYYRIEVGDSPDKPTMKFKIKINRHKS